LTNGEGFFGKTKLNQENSDSVLKAVGVEKESEINLD
jgi:hypothetical protein